MPHDHIELVTIPCLADNYAFLVHNHTTDQTALIDAPEAAPIQKALSERGWRLSNILLTHHHDDHIDAVPALRDGARVIGAAADAHRLPPLDMQVSDSEIIEICGIKTCVIDVPGHTIGHIAFHMPDPKYAFTADSLMALGCGRLFEGSPTQMWQSLKKLRALPKDTIICSGHEYTQNNARFALSLDPTNTSLMSRVKRIETARENEKPTVPSTLKDEMQTNPFLRADDPKLKQALDMNDASDIEVFTHIRQRKDKF